MGQTLALLEIWTISIIFFIKIIFFINHILFVISELKN